MYIKFTKQYLSFEMGAVLKGDNLDRHVASKVAVVITDKEYVEAIELARKKHYESQPKPKVAVKKPCADCGDKSGIEAENKALKTENEVLKSKIAELEKEANQAVEEVKPKAPKK